MNVRRYAVIAVGVVSLLGLTGCSGGDGIAALDRAGTLDDQLPGYVLTQGVDVDSVRQVAEHKGIRYFISRTEEDNGFCVIRTKGQDERAWGTACSTGTGKVVSNPTTGILEVVTLVTDGYATDDLEEDGWIRIQENLLILQPTRGTGPSTCIVVAGRPTVRSRV
jgi:hypothetical protein